MKIIVGRDDLVEGLRSVQGIVGKSTMKVLEYVKLEVSPSLGLELTTTNLTITITKKVNCKNLEHGAVLLPCKQLSAFASHAGDAEVEIAVNGDNIATVKAASAQLRLAGLPISEFPKMPSCDGDAFKLPQKAFADMIRKTAYAASVDRIRVALQGVFAHIHNGKMAMVATDGRRLAIAETTIGEEVSDKEILLPIQAVRELQKIISDEGDIEIRTANSQAVFQMGGITIFTKLIDEAYPNYNAIIPSEFDDNVSVDRQRLIDAIMRVSIVADDDNQATTFAFKDKMLTISAKNSMESATQDVVPIEYRDALIPHNEMSVCYNYAFILNALKAMEDEMVSIGLNSGNRPTKITGKDGFTYVVMPIRQF